MVHTVPTNCPTTGVPDEALQRKGPRVWERGSEVHLSIPCLEPGSMAEWGEGLGWRGTPSDTRPHNVSRPMRFLRQCARNRNSGKTRGATGPQIYMPRCSRRSKEMVSAQDVADGKLRF